MYSNDVQKTYDINYAFNFYLKTFVQKLCMEDFCTEFIDGGPLYIKLYVGYLCIEIMFVRPLHRNHVKKTLYR